MYNLNIRTLPSDTYYQQYIDSLVSKQAKKIQPSLIDGKYKFLKMKNTQINVPSKVMSGYERIKYIRTYNSDALQFDIFKQKYQQQRSATYLLKYNPLTYQYNYNIMSSFMGINQNPYILSFKLMEQISQSQFNGTTHLSQMTSLATTKQKLKLVINNALKLGTTVGFNVTIIPYIFKQIMYKFSLLLPNQHQTIFFNYCIESPLTQISKYFILNFIIYNHKYLQNIAHCVQVNFILIYLMSAFFFFALIQSQVVYTNVVIGKQSFDKSSFHLKTIVFINQYFQRMLGKKSLYGQIKQDFFLMLFKKQVIYPQPTGSITKQFIGFVPQYRQYAQIKYNSKQNKIIQDIIGQIQFSTDLTPRINRFASNIAHTITHPLQTVRSALKPSVQSIKKFVNAPSKPFHKDDPIYVTGAKFFYQLNNQATTNLPTTFQIIQQSTSKAKYLANVGMNIGKAGYNLISKSFKKINQPQSQYKTLQNKIQKVYQDMNNRMHGYKADMQQHFKDTKLKKQQLQRKINQQMYVVNRLFQDKLRLSQGKTQRAQILFESKINKMRQYINSVQKKLFSQYQDKHSIQLKITQLTNLLYEQLQKFQTKINRSSIIQEQLNLLLASLQSKFNHQLLQFKTQNSRIKQQEVVKNTQINHQINMIKTIIQSQRKLSLQQRQQIMKQVQKLTQNIYESLANLKQQDNQKYYQYTKRVQYTQQQMQQAFKLIKYNTESFDVMSKTVQEVKSIIQTVKKDQQQVGEMIRELFQISRNNISNYVEKMQELQSQQNNKYTQVRNTIQQLTQQYRSHFSVKLKEIQKKMQSDNKLTEIKDQYVNLLQKINKLPSQQDFSQIKKKISEYDAMFKKQFDRNVKQQTTVISNLKSLQQQMRDKVNKLNIKHESLQKISQRNSYNASKNLQQLLSLGDKLYRLQTRMDLSSNVQADLKAYLKVSITQLQSKNQILTETLFTKIKEVNQQLQKLRKQVPLTYQKQYNQLIKDNQLILQTGKQLKKQMQVFKASSQQLKMHLFKQNQQMLRETQKLTADQHNNLVQKYQIFQNMIKQFKTQIDQLRKQIISHEKSLTTQMQYKLDKDQYQKQYSHLQHRLNLNSNSISSNVKHTGTLANRLQQVNEKIGHLADLDEKLNQLNALYEQIIH